MTPTILWLLGLLLIFLEFYLPGAILGILGGICLFASLFIYASESDSVILTLIFLLGMIASVALLIRFTLWRIRNSKPDYSIFSNASQSGFFASKYDKDAVGKVGIALSDLKPGGYILIEGQQHQALSQSGYIEKGNEVIVLSGQEESLIVKSTKKRETS